MAQAAMPHDHWNHFAGPRVLGLGAW